MATMIGRVTRRQQFEADVRRVDAMLADLTGRRDRPDPAQRLQDPRGDADWRDSLQARIDAWLEYRAYLHRREVRRQHREETRRAQGR